MLASTIIYGCSEISVRPDADDSVLQIRTNRGYVHELVLVDLPADVRDRLRRAFDARDLTEQSSAKTAAAAGV